MQRFFWCSIFLLLIAACGPAAYTSMVTPSSEPTEKGTIFLISKGTGNTDKLAELEAEKNAFLTLLFKGVPGTQQNTPLVPNESESKEQHKKFYDDFFNKEQYRQFIISNELNGIKKVRKGKEGTITIKINLDRLRKYLEDEGIIRKFGI